MVLQVSLVVDLMGQLIFVRKNRGSDVKALLPAVGVPAAR